MSGENTALLSKDAFRNAMTSPCFAGDFSSAGTVTSSTPGHVAIIGAGPCGLACAAELDRLGHRDWEIVEAAPEAGGLASSVVDEAGFTWDLGGHVVFSHFGEFDRLVAELFADNELLSHDRSSFIRFADRWVPYPFQQHLGYLPAADAQACEDDLRSAGSWPPRPQGESTNFATWLEANYGRALVDRFFAPYNTKVWTVPPEQMSASWVAERVAPSNRETASGDGSTNRQWGPNATFLFPARGGTGEIWRRLATRCGDRLSTGVQAVAVDAGRSRLCLSDGRHLNYSHLVSTIPMDRLVEMTTDAPQSLRDSARALKHTSVAMVGLGYRCPTIDERSWLYFPDPSICFYRVTNFSKYSPAHVPDGDPGRFCSWMTETALRPGAGFNPAELIDSCDNAIRTHLLVPDGARRATAHVETIPYAYPVPTLGRDSALAQLNPWLEGRNILSRGRFGTWRYEIGNMDHAVKMGVDAARRLVQGATENLLSSVPTPTAKLITT